MIKEITISNREFELNTSKYLKISRNNHQIFVTDDDNDNKIIMVIGMCDFKFEIDNTEIEEILNETEDSSNIIDHEAWFH